jgi:predicted nucleic acid-binding protein
VKRVYVLDASAWAKRYKEEKGSEWIDNLFMQAEKGEIDLCLLPISYYEVYWVVQKAIRTLKNRSSSERPQMRFPIASPEQIALLEQKIKEDWDLRQEISKLAPEPIANWSLDSIDRNVLSLMKRYPISPNDALILAVVSKLQQVLAEQNRQLFFVGSDPKLNEAVGQLIGEGYVINPEQEDDTPN